MRDPPAPLLMVDNVSKQYGEVRALAGANLQVGRGEFVALLGQNGAGKSTLLQILTGLFAPTGGTVSVLGIDLQHHPAAALARIGVVFQQPTLDLELSVTANLLFHADLHGIARREARRRLAVVLDRVGLAAAGNNPVRNLSGGNRRRVELARALLHEPDLLLMDEPTVGLDPASRRDILQHVHTLALEGRVGVLWTTHLTDEADAADRVIVLHRGRVLYDGAPAAFKQQEGASTVKDAFLQLVDDAPVTPAERAEAARPPL